MPSWQSRTHNKECTLCYSKFPRSGREHVWISLGMTQCVPLLGNLQIAQCILLAICTIAPQRHVQGSPTISGAKVAFESPFQFQLKSLFTRSLYCSLKVLDQGQSCTKDSCVKKARVQTTRFEPYTPAPPTEVTIFTADEHIDSPCIP